MAVLLALIDACGPAKSPPITTPPSQSPPQRWADLSAARAWPLAAPPFISRGHGGEHYLVEIRVTPAVLADYRTLVAGRRWPPGTAAAAFHRSRESGAPGSIYAMIKSADGWSYLVVDQGGRIETGSGLQLCARCHADAPADSLFGAPAAPASAALTPAASGSMP